MGEYFAAALIGGATSAIGGLLKMRDMGNKNAAEIKSIADKHDSCCQRLEAFEGHIYDRNMHIDKDMWRELTDRLRSIEEYIRDHPR